eukprot:98660-Amphidinium_carterae.1
MVPFGGQWRHYPQAHPIRFQALQHQLSPVHPCLTKVKTTSLAEQGAWRRVPLVTPPKGEPARSAQGISLVAPSGRPHLSPALSLC